MAYLVADSHLSQLVVSRAVGKLAEMLATEGVRNQGSGDEEDKLVELTCKLLHEHTVRSIYILSYYVNDISNAYFTCELILLHCVIRYPFACRKGFYQLADWVALSSMR